jgi:hypothetical protein
MSHTIRYPVFVTPDGDRFVFPSIVEDLSRDKTIDFFQCLELTMTLGLEKGRVAN